MIRNQEGVQSHQLGTSWKRAERHQMLSVVDQVCPSRPRDLEEDESPREFQKQGGNRSDGIPVGLPVSSLAAFTLPRKRPDFPAGLRHLQNQNKPVVTGG